MKNFSKVISAILVVLMLLTAAPLQGFVGLNIDLPELDFSQLFTPNAKAATYGDLTYTVMDGQVTITACDSSATVVNIPEKIEGFPVTAIGSNAFSWCTMLTSVTVPDSVTKIGDWAFNSCQSLTGIVIPDSVTSIGICVFNGCQYLTSVTLPEDITSIGQYVFADCWRLADINIPDTVSSIDFRAFYACYSLESITISNSECKIYDSADTIDSGVTIYGYEGSTAESYAKKYRRNFVAEHYYSAAVTPPTCTAQGFTTYTCDCGDTYVADYVTATGHSHTSEITTPATHLTEGVMTYTCTCGDTYTEVIAKITEHSHNAVVTAPTCTAQGFTTYTCSCGDTYVSNYTDATGHSHTSEITTPATHLTEGVMTFTCACGDTYTEVIAKITEHSHNAVVTAPTCTEQGFTTYTCSCGDSYVSDYMDTVPHTDTEGDGACDVCDRDIAPDDEDNTNNCSHICHKTGFLGFFAKIAIFFWRLFGINPVCSCGAAHY